MISSVKKKDITKIFTMNSKSSLPLGSLENIVKGDLTPIGPKYRDREIVARPSKGHNPGFGRTPVKGTI